MVCLCERDMTCLSGKLEQCRVHTMTARRDKAFPRKPNAPLLFDSSLNFNAAAIDPFHPALAYLPSEQPQSCLTRPVSSSATQICRISLTLVPT